MISVHIHAIKMAAYITYEHHSLDRSSENLYFHPNRAPVHVFHNYASDTLGFFLPLC